MLYQTKILSKTNGVLLFLVGTSFVANVLPAYLPPFEGLYYSFNYYFGVNYVTGVIFPLLIFYFIMNGKHHFEPQSEGHIPSPSKSKTEAVKKIPTNGTKGAYEIELVSIPGTDMQVKPCCYYAARLGETYCMCGKLVNQKVIEILQA